MPTKTKSNIINEYLELLDTNVRIPLKEVFGNPSPDIEANESFEMPVRELLHDIFNPKTATSTGSGTIKATTQVCCIIPYKVIFAEPATIIIWEDKTKTVVKCSPKDTYDKEKGIALCFMKKILGNTGYYNEIFKRYIKEEAKVE